MEGMFSIVGITIIVFGILQIILFFKIWGMTDDIRAIKNKYINNVEDSAIPTSSNRLQYEVGDLVVSVKDDKQMRIKEIKGEKYSCFSNNGITFEGDFLESEIRLFNPLSSI